MDLTKIKEILAKLDLSEGTKTQIDALVAQAETSGLTQEIKDKIMEILDLDAEADSIEAEYLDEVAMALDAFANDSEAALDIATKDVEATTEAFEEETKDLPKTE